MSADDARKLPHHLHFPMTAHADTQMVRNAVGEQYDALAEPPEVDVPRAHGLCAPIIAGLREVYDPEIPVNIYELGLIYRIEINDIAEGQADVQVTMTLTSPGCPVAQEMPEMVRMAILPVAGVRDVEVEIIWDPTWTPAMMAETAKMQLNMFT